MDSGGHVLTIDGIPSFTVDAAAPETVTRDLHLDAGIYRLYCTIPGHAEAGEEILLSVR